MYNFNNVGKGVYIWQPAAIESGNPYEILSRLQMAGVQSVALKICDGFTVLGGLELLIQVLRQNNIIVAGWGYSYLTKAPQQEAQVVASACKRYNPDFYLIDVEAEVENNYTGAELFMNVLRPALAGLPLGLNTFWDPSEHPLFPWATFLSNVDFACPQVYWRGVDPIGKLKQSQQGYASIPNAPQVPMPIVAGDMYIDNGVEPTPDQIAQFLSTVNTDPTLHGVFMWAADDTQTTPELWQAFSQYQWNGGAAIPSQPIGWGQVKTPLGLYIRATPAGSKLGALTKGELTPIWFINSDQWAAITPAHDQWVFVGDTNYITVVMNPGNVPPPPPPLPSLFQAKVIPAAGLNVRDNPNGNKIGALSANTIVQVYEESNGWAKISPTQSQWVSETYLSKIS
ncbi:MAG: SH3 domain-containing protein [Anaerolineales bacterium]